VFPQSPGEGRSIRYQDLGEAFVTPVVSLAGTAGSSCRPCRRPPGRWLPVPGDGRTVTSPRPAPASLPDRGALGAGVRRRRVRRLPSDGDHRPAVGDDRRTSRACGRWIAVSYLVGAHMYWPGREFGRGLRRHPSTVRHTVLKHLEPDRTGPCRLLYPQADGRFCSRRRTHLPDPRRRDDHPLVTATGARAHGHHVRGEVAGCSLACRTISQPPSKH
jgi:hypothetical protein